ncbi:cytochrome c [Domibacillus indicus]|uniref:cytochrome c550 n=1 Tax=Domibacillus indicus TaxID=1437523 RepID=UPI002040BE50|nr:cytochrome c [Domibacillus indicus]MCM3788453.1 cytochrome c [Domibacillus indicus]
MNRNPLIPFLLIAVFGLGLMFFLSLDGIDNAKERAEEEKAAEEGGGETAAGGEFDPEAHYKSSCISCHGSNYEGGAGPSLVGVGEKLSQEEIQDIVVNGKGGMPPGLVPQENAEAMAAWVAEIK